MLLQHHLTQKNALIFRITHINNLDDLLQHGCRSRSLSAGTNYAEIGNQELIAKRLGRTISCGPGGHLGDYVPFYFTPYSPMMLNIKTGHNGIQKQPMSEILILASFSAYSAAAECAVCLFGSSRLFENRAVFVRPERPRSHRLACSSGTKFSEGRPGSDSRSIKQRRSSTITCPCPRSPISFVLMIWFGRVLSWR